MWRSADRLTHHSITANVWPPMVRGMARIRCAKRDGQTASMILEIYYVSADYTTSTGVSSGYLLWREASEQKQPAASYRDSLA